MSSIIDLLLIVLFLTLVDCKLTLTSTTVFDTNQINDDEDIERGTKSDERINLSFPGTRWCGPGNTATGYDELGKYKDTDKCCRDHDHCDNIGSGEEKYGLVNNDVFTILHCKCDQEFSGCLRGTHTTISNKIGYTYFSVRNRCYKNDYPIIECQKYDYRFFLRRCSEYILDTTKPKVYQYFDLPFYGKDEDSLGRC